MKKMWTYLVYVTAILLNCAYVSSLVIDTETDTRNNYVKVNTGNMIEERDNQQSQNLTIVSTLPEIVNRINSIVNHSTGGDWVTTIDELITKISDRLQHEQDSDQQVVLHDAPAVGSKSMTHESQIALDVDDPGKLPHIIERHGPNLFHSLGMRNTNSVPGNQYQNEKRIQKPDPSFHKSRLFPKFMAAFQQFGKFHNQPLDSNGLNGNSMFKNALDKFGYGDDKQPHASLQALHPMDNLQSSILEGNGDISLNKLGALPHWLGANMNPHPAQHGNRDIPKPGLNGNSHRNPGRDHPHGKHGIDIDLLTPKQLHSLLQYLRGLKESNGRATFEPKLHELCCIVG